MMTNEPANHALLAGDAGHARLVALPVPALADDDSVLVRMLYAPINPADLLSLDGNYAFAMDADATLGAEGVGVVERAGASAGDLRPGDLVLPLDRGNWCRYRSVRCDRLVKVPAGVDPQQAAMMRINPPTAWGLLAATGARDGDCIVQNAATSVVARWVRLLAARRDIHVVDVVRAGSSGADAVVDDADMLDGVRRASGGRPIRAALDCVAGEATGRLAATLSPGGQVIVFGHLSGQPSTIRSQLLTGQGLSVRGFSLRPAEQGQSPADRDRMFADLWAIAREEDVRLPVKARVPLGQAAQALALARESGGGRVLFDLQASDM